MNFKDKEKEKSRSEDRISTDPFGSYTGTPDDKDEEPIQDVDDL